MKTALLALAGTLFVVPAIAAAQPAPMIIGQQNGLVLRAGTAVPLKTVTELTTKGKKLKVGQRFDLEVAEPVMIAGKTVIPVGSRAVGEITTVRNKGMWGKSGNIDARILYVQANDRQIRLSGALNDKGTTGTAGVVGAVALVPVAGFFMTGTSAVIAPGTAVVGYLDEDVPVAFADNAGPAPMTVAPAMPVAAGASAAVIPAVATPVSRP